jgi:hypothetical protein
MCTRAIEPQSSCKNLSALNKDKLLVSGDKITSTLEGTYGRRVSPPTRPQASVTTSSLPFLYFSNSFSAKVFDLVYPYTKQNPENYEISGSDNRILDVMNYYIDPLMIHFSEISEGTTSRESLA